MQRRNKMQAVLAVLIVLCGTPVSAGGPAGSIASLDHETKKFLVRALINERLLPQQTREYENERIASAVMEYYFDHKDEFRLKFEDSRTVDMVLCSLGQRGYAVGMLMNGSAADFCRSNWRLPVPR
ncbi:hypothetical protein ACC848_05570 [Rhizobium johnstonii]|uniref:hypothetical protein n=1 Tax=Rhizobium johnstonii TaxID=3019933 RepID=UPI003F95B977